MRGPRPRTGLGAERTPPASPGRRIERTVTPHGGGPWLIAPVGRGYYLPGAGSEPGTMLDDDEALTFELVAQSNDPNGAPEPLIEQLHFDFHAAFANANANADAMRRYARILLDVTGHADGILSGSH